MSLYLDASALVKLVKREPETAALRRYLRRHSAERLVTSALSRTEVVRAVLPGGGDALATARQVVAGTALILVDAGILDDAAILAPDQLLRTLDAIHLASARLLGPNLRAVVSYDHRMSAAATSLGMAVVSPS